MNLLDDHYVADGVADKIISKISGTTDCNKKDISLNHFKYDQFHIGGAAATQKLLKLMGDVTRSVVLDEGAGYGCVARYLAHFGGANVVAVDLAQGYVESAQKIHESFPFSGGVTYLQGDVCGDFSDAEMGAQLFDWCVWVHLGMNISNKEGALRTLCNKLSDKGKIIIYDVLKVGGDVLVEECFPLPWAENEAQSFVDDVRTYENKLLNAGFKVVYKEKYGDILPKIINNPTPDDVIPLAGSDFKLCLENLRQLLARGAVVPWFIIAEKI